MTLQNFLLAILTGSFAVGPAVFMLLERIPAFASVDPEYKRWVVAVLSGIAGLAAWALALWFGYVETPLSYSAEYVGSGIWQYGVLTGYSAFMSATLMHGHYAMTKNTFVVTSEDADEAE